VNDHRWRFVPNHLRALVDQPEAIVLYKECEFVNRRGLELVVTH